MHRYFKFLIFALIINCLFSSSLYAQEYTNEELDAVSQVISTSVADTISSLGAFRAQITCSLGRSTCLDSARVAIEGVKSMVSQAQ